MDQGFRSSIARGRAAGDGGLKGETALNSSVNGTGLTWFSSYSDMMPDLSIGAYGLLDLRPLSEL